MPIQKITPGVVDTSVFSSPTISSPIISGNLSLDSTGTSGIRLPAANTLTFHTAGTEDMRIDSSGNVGIGATSLSNKLTIAHADEKGITFKATGTDGTTAAQLFFEDTNGGTGGVFRFDHDVNSFTFATAGTTERMRIDSNGYVTMPSQPAFWTCVLGGDTYSGVGWSKIRLTSGESSAFGESFINFSSHRFTAPVAGRYFFSAAITMTGSTNTDGTIGFAKNGASSPANGRSISYQSSTGLGGMDVTHAMNLAANDYIEVYMYQSGTQTTRNTQYAGYFSGFLIG